MIFGALSSGLLVALVAVCCCGQHQNEPLPQPIATAGSATAKTPGLAAEIPAWRQKMNAYAIPPVDRELALQTLKVASKYGLPSGDNLRLFNKFLLAYDRRLRNPIWVMEHLTADNCTPIRANRSEMYFKADTELHPYFRASYDDWTDNNRRFSKYDRGHMAPAGDYLSNQAAMGQTFSLSNIVPQTAALNRGAWVRLEKYVLFLANHTDTREIFVTTGPMYLPQLNSENQPIISYKLIGASRIAVPSHFFKIFLRVTTEEKLILDLFVMPNSYDEYLNDVKCITEFRWPLKDLPDLEKATGLIFFSKLDRNQVSQPPMDKLEFDFEDKKLVFDN